MGEQVLTMSLDQLHDRITKAKVREVLEQLKDDFWVRSNAASMGGVDAHAECRARTWERAARHVDDLLKKYND